MDNINIETVTLPDGRRGERHTSIDSQGKEIVEIFAEEQQPLRLEKRILREKKEIVAKETTETIMNGEVVEVEVKDLEPQVPLQVREKIGLADHAKIVDGDYVRKEEVVEMVEKGVVAAITALIDQDVFTENEDDVYRCQQPEPQSTIQPVPCASARAMVEQNVAQKSKRNILVDIGIGTLILAQVAFFAWYAFSVM